MHFRLLLALEHARKAALKRRLFECLVERRVERLFVADCMHALSLTPAPVHAGARACR
jgi:hypothetical protein